MTRANLEAAIRYQPFRPFLLHTSSGRAIRVGQPEEIAYHPDSTVVVVVGRSGGFELLELALLAGIEFEGESDSAVTG